VNAEKNAAKSSHACDKCHRKMHAYCGQPIGEEGFGQARRCAVCSKVDTISLDKKPTKGRPKTRQDIPGKKDLNIRGYQNNWIWCHLQPKKLKLMLIALQIIMIVTKQHRLMNQ